MTNQPHPFDQEEKLGAVGSAQSRRVMPDSPFVRFEEAEVEQSIGRRFEQQVRLCSDKLALKSATREWSYASLNRAANCVASVLAQTKGSDSGTVALLLETDALLVASMLGAVKVGRPYVPLDPLFPRERNHYILEDCQAEIVITNEQNLDLAQQWARSGIALVNLNELDFDQEAADPQRSVGPESLAYLLYTSGSTGQPKGVMHTHRTLLHMVMKYTNGIHISAQDRMSLLASGSFAASVSDIYGALLNGAALFPFSVGEHGIGELGRWLEQEAITLYASTPTLFRSLANLLKGQATFPHLRLMKLGGELVTRKDVELYRSFTPPKCLLHVSLGSTEMSSIRQYNLDKETTVAGDTVPVGYEQAGTHVILLDESGNEVGVNEIGEVAVKSRFLFPGYWRNPEATQKKLRSCSNNAEERIFLTGDLGRLGEDGCLEILGRMDSQVKIHGYRVELGEVEAALAQHPAVKATAVAVVGNGEDQKLVAYLVARADTIPTTKELRAHVRSRLPNYMAPSLYMTLESLPLTPSGKVDRQALPTLRNLPAIVTYEGANNGSLVDTLRSIWERVLGHDEFEADDDFFDVGGDSLLAISVVAQMSHALGREFDLSILRQDSTLTGIARTIEEMELQPTGAKRTSEAIQSTEPTHTTGRPLTPFERTMVVMSDGATLNACVISRVRGPLTEAGLTTALAGVQRRHPLLRVRIVDGRSYTEEAVPAIPLHVLDCDEHSTTAIVERELSAPLPVERGPLIRVSWLRHKSNLGTLVFTFHHVIGDGVSSAILVRDLIGAAAGTLNLPFRSLDTVTPLEEILPAELRGWRGHWRFLRLFARSLWRAATHGRPLQLRVARWVPPAERTIHVLGRSLKGAFLGALAKKAHAEHTGVHGALAAAICMAVAGDGRAVKTTPVLFGSMVDVRDHLEPVMGEEFGVYAGFSQFRELIDPCGDLWEVARRVQAELVRDAQQHRPLTMLRMVRLGMKWSGMGRRPTAEVANRFAQAAPVTGGLSFVQSLPQARLSIEPKVGPLEIETLHFAASPSAMGDMTFVASLFAGHLQLHAMWPEPAIDEAQANSIVDGVIARLEAAVSWSQWGGRSAHRLQEAPPESNAHSESELLIVS